MSLQAQQMDSLWSIRTYGGIQKSYDLNYNTGRFTFETFGMALGVRLSLSPVQLEGQLTYNNLRSTELSKLISSSSGGNVVHTRLQAMYVPQWTFSPWTDLNVKWAVGNHWSYQMIDIPNLHNNRFSHALSAWVNLRVDADYSIDILGSHFQLKSSLYHSPWTPFVMQSNQDYGNSLENSWSSLPWIDGYRIGMQLEFKWLTRVPWGVQYRWDYQVQTKLYRTEFAQQGVLLYYELDV